jgi:hypothetical protein
MVIGEGCMCTGENILKQEWNIWRLMGDIWRGDIAEPCCDPWGENHAKTQCRVLFLTDGLSELL